MRRRETHWQDNLDPPPPQVVTDGWERRRVMQETPHEYVQDPDSPWCAECALHRDARCHQQERAR